MARPLLTILTGPSVDYSDDEKKISAASRTIGAALVGIAVFAVVALTIWAAGLKGSPSFAAVMGANLLVGLAAAAAGAVFGFIFGIPRTMSVTERQAMANVMKETGATEKNQAVMAVNSNLERVSDWLTTLLIGATLVQIKEIAGWVGGLGSKLFSENGVPSNDAIVPVIVILFFSLSFLGIYLITRLYLTSALSLLAKGGGRGADTTQVELAGKLNAAIESGKKEDITTALKALDDAKLSDDVRNNPALNASRARALAKLISGGDTSGRTDAKAELRAAVDNAVADPTVADELKKDAAKSLATGDATLDADISARLNAAGSPSP